MTKTVSLADLNAQVPAEVIVGPEQSSGGRLGVYRIWVRSEPARSSLLRGEPAENESHPASREAPNGSASHSSPSPEKISATTLRSMSKSSPGVGSSSANYWRLLRRAEKRRLRRASEAHAQAQRKLDFEESFAVISLSDVPDIGSFEDIPLSAAFPDFDPVEEEVDEVEVEDVEGRGRESDSDSEDDEVYTNSVFTPTFLITYRLDDMETFFLSSSVPENLNKLVRSWFLDSKMVDVSCQPVP